MNAIWYDETDGSLIISGRNQGVVKVTSNNQLVWILAPHKGWGKAGVDGDGVETSDFLLTAVDDLGVPHPADAQLGTINSGDFEWCWGQHTSMLLPNGNLFLFDNGFNRNFVTGTPTYSRAVEYEIDETNMTIKQVWQYGMERGTDLYAPIISDVDLLDNGNRLMTSGMLFDLADPRALVSEITYPGKTLAFEAVFSF